MIVTRREGGLCLVAQAEHGRVAGELAAHWGNDRFSSPTPRESVVVAARRHDDGWRARDAQVLLNEAQRRPLHFLEIDPDEHVRLYQEGVEAVRLGDVYAGVLVGMHWTGLYRGRWRRPGVRGRLARRDGDERVLDEVVLREEHRWVVDKQRAWAADEPRSVFEATLWHNYELLQLWDLLSLYLCVMPQEPAAGDTAPVPWGPQLVSLAHSPQPVLLPAVRTRAFGSAAPVTATVSAPRTVTLDPWPFREQSFHVEVEQTVVADTAYEDAAAARRGVAAGRAEALVWTLRAAPGEGKAPRATPPR